MLNILYNSDHCNQLHITLLLHNKDTFYIYKNKITRTFIYT